MTKNMPDIYYNGIRFLFFGVVLLTVYVDVLFLTNLLVNYFRNSYNYFIRGIV